jgi:predicted nucleic acid-binding protein
MLCMRKSPPQGQMRQVAAQSWIEIEEVDPLLVAPFLTLVGRGEAEAIALTQRRSSAVLLIDDLRARKLAQHLGLRRIGTVGFLALAKRDGLISTLKPALDALLAHGIYIRQDLINAALKEAGE